MHVSLFLYMCGLWRCLSICRSVSVCVSLIHKKGANEKFVYFNSLLCLFILQFCRIIVVVTTQFVHNFTRFLFFFCSFRPQLVANFYMPRNAVGILFLAYLFGSITRQSALFLFFMFCFSLLCYLIIYSLSVCMCSRIEAF